MSSKPGRGFVRLPASKTETKRRQKSTSVDVSSLERILFVPDTHAPYHDGLAWYTMLAAARALRPTRIVVLGDLADFYAVSFFCKDPRRASMLTEELPNVNRRLDELDSLGAAKKYYVRGNHEFRLDRYIQDKAPALWGLTSLSKLLHLKKRGWQDVPYRDGIHIGKLYVTHDLSQAGQFAARRAREAVEGNVVIGHTHRLDIHYQPNQHGVPKFGMSFGWLGDFEAIDYQHKMLARRSWVHGFGIGYLDKSGDVFLQGIPIVNGRCCVNGRLIKAA